MPIKTFKKILDFYHGNKERTMAWFNTYHPRLNGKPMDMLKKGSHKRITKYIEEQLVKNGY